MYTYFSMRTCIHEDMWYVTSVYKKVTMKKKSVDIYTGIPEYNNISILNTFKGLLNTIIFHY